MTAIQILTFLLFELHLNRPLSVITLSRVNWDHIQSISAEDAAELVEDLADNLLREATGLLLHPHFPEAGMELSPEMSRHVAELMYLPGVNYPFEKLLEEYNELLELGSQSDTFYRALEVAQNLPPHLLLN